MKFTEKLEALRQAGFQISYADRGEWVREVVSTEHHGTAEHPIDIHTTREVWHPLNRVPGHVYIQDVHDSPRENTRAYIDLGAVGRGEDQAGQSSSVDRSNFRSIQRDYPDTFTPVAYANVDSLGAFVGNLDAEHIEMLAGLHYDYPVYDEEDTSQLEHDEIQESYGQYAKDDVADHLPEDARDMWDNLEDVNLPGYEANGVEIPERDAQEDLFWDAYSRNEGNDYAEHHGVEVVWDYPKMAAALAERLDGYFGAEHPNANEPRVEAVPGQDALPGMDREAGE